MDHAPQEALQGNCPYLVKYFDVPVFTIRFIFRYRHLVAAQSGHKLTLLYLANDVVQNCRKKQPEIEAEFGLVMKKVQMIADQLSLIIPFVTRKDRFKTVHRCSRILLVKPWTKRL